MNLSEDFLRKAKDLHKNRTKRIMRAFCIKDKKVQKGV
jgi:hypothetical protein